MNFEPKIVAYVCNWCTYLGADLAGTNRLEYPPNVRIVRLPCTGRIDFNLIVKAFEVGADSVLVSGCHPGDCHYTAGNYHARRRWMLFRPLLETLGFDLRRIYFTWISAAEGRKFQQMITEITEQTRALGPANYLATQQPANGQPAASEQPAERRHWPATAFLPSHLKRKEVKALGRVPVVTTPAFTRALNVLEQEGQVDRNNIEEVPVEVASGPPHFERLAKFLEQTPDERMAFWMREFERCTKCYACRQACPLCYCERCIVDKNRPQSISPSATLEGNFAWHITRAFHQAGRCAGCGECSRACPAGIDLGLLNLTLAKAALDQFGYRPGAERGAEPLIGAYSLADKEDFIR